MPRPPDTYTHTQFEPIESDHQGETVRCRHCKNWTGSVKTLNRKKDHLLRCPAYASWRAAGNGQELLPPNRYNRRDGLAPLDDSGLYGYEDEVNNNYTANPPRNKLADTDLNKAFDEFWDDAETQRCMRARCKYCGAVRAKNTTRQYEHLQQCNDFLASTEGQQAQAEGVLQATPVSTGSARKDIWRGSAPNPNLIMSRPQAKPRQPSGRPSMTPQQPKPSLVNHLLFRLRSDVEQATQVPFLSHAGCGTLSQQALRQWLCQQSHISRAFTTYIGSLIGKIRLPETKNPQADTSFRTFDLLVSTLNNAQRELDFLRSTSQKYGLSSDGEQPSLATKGFIDLFSSSASANASLLEGLVVLWAFEHLSNLSWQYAANFFQPAPPPSSTSYSLPSYLQPGQFGNSTGPSGAAPGMGPSASGAAGSNAADSTAHVSALHEALIPNWTSQGFVKFVDVCRAIVDELANAQTTGSGATELNTCEMAFRQVCWLLRLLWPLVTGMGEHEETVPDGAAGPPPPSVAPPASGVVGAGGAGPGGHHRPGPAGLGQNGAGGNGSASAAAVAVQGSAGNVLEIADDDDDVEDEDVDVDDVDRDDADEDAAGTDSPYGGTGLGAIAAANRSG